jgi:hypothetical protein
MKEGDTVARGCLNECPTVRKPSIDCCSKDLCNDSNSIKISGVTILGSLAVVLFLKITNLSL